MAEVTITRLVPGAVAAVADHNANVAEWNAKTAAGQIEESNVRQEGLDYPNVMDASVEATDRAGASRFYESDTASGNIAAPGKVTMGGLDVQITGITVSSGDTVEVRFAGWITGVVGAQVKLYLESNNGGGWGGIPSTQRPFSSAVGEVLVDNYCVTHKHTATGTWSFRLAVSNVTAGSVNVRNAVLFAEVLAR